MEKLITLGGKEVKLRSSAATTILYKNTFHEDFLVKFSAYANTVKDMKDLYERLEELKNNTEMDADSKIEQMSAIMNDPAYIKNGEFLSDSIPKLTYIMVLEGTEKSEDLFRKLNETSYLIWLLSVDQSELTSIVGDVIELWRQSTQTLSKSKN